MTKFRPLLGAAVDDPKRFVPFVLEASGRLGPEAGAFLEYLQSISRESVSGGGAPLRLVGPHYLVGVSKIDH